MSIEPLSGKVFLLITGASRGIGQQIAITFSSLLQEGSHVLLLARNLNALHEVAKNMSPKVMIHTFSMDLSKSTREDFEDIISESLKGVTRKTFDRVVLVHNVGSMGDVSKHVNEMTDLNVWREYYDINLFVPAVLNAVIMNTFDASTNTLKLIINITSLYAIQAARGCGYYCPAKAAREMYFKVFAIENPDVDVLSYSPGPVDTDMFNMICENLADTDARETYKAMKKTKTVLTPKETVNRLVEVLKEHKYKSADHVDYYDKL